MELKESVQRQFGSVASHYAGSHVHAGGPDLEALVERALASGARHALDVGCGAGHTALALAAQGLQVVALDLTVEMLAQGQSLADERGLAVRFERGDVEALPFEANHFDLVTSRYSAHHYPAPQRAVAEVARVLRPGGRFLLVDIVAPPTPTADSFLQTIELVRDPSHVRDHQTREWCAMLETAGFSPSVRDHYPCFIDFAAWIGRMETPEPEVRVLERLLDGAAQESRDALAIGQPGAHDFTLQTVLIEAVLS
jgi:ubiquinone/menaquinone biosynthesis C-methylase UbiE